MPKGSGLATERSERHVNIDDIPAEVLNDHTPVPSPTRGKSIGSNYAGTLDDRCRLGDRSVKDSCEVFPDRLVFMLGEEIALSSSSSCS